MGKTHPDIRALSEYRLLFYASTRGIGIGHRQSRHVHNPPDCGAGREDVDRLGRTQQNRAHSDVATGCGLEQVVRNIGSIDIWQNQ